MNLFFTNFCQDLQQRLQAIITASSGISFSLFCLGLTLSTNTFAAAEGIGDPVTYRAVYEADYKGLPISAKGIRELKKNADGSYTLSSIATSFIAKLSETTQFDIVDKQYLPKHYEFHRSGIGKKRNAILDFDWQNQTVLNNVQSKPWKMSIPEGALDKLLYQLKMREDLQIARDAGIPWPDLSYQIADGGKMKQYDFSVLGEAVIKTPIGALNTLKVQRMRKNSARTTIFWLSLEHDFMLVKFQQQKEDGSGFELRLKSATFGGKELSR